MMVWGGCSGPAKLQSLAGYILSVTLFCFLPAFSIIYFPDLFSTQVAPVTPIYFPPISPCC
jgi:hypothetical protein